MQSPDTALSAVDRHNLGDKVTDQLREAIVSGVLTPGQRLRESDLSATLRVSRSPLREALNRLGSERLLTARPYRGAVVAPMTLGDMEEVYSLRMSLEVLAVRLAIQRATPEDLVALTEVAARSPLDAGPRRQGAVAELDVTFHDLIYRAARHERLYHSWSLLRPHILRYLVWRNTINSDYQEIYGSEHGQLVQAIAAGESGHAEAMISSHLEGAYRRLVDAYSAERASPEHAGR
jgi:DNA-binding GntR family transcriptional regulator